MEVHYGNKHDSMEKIEKMKYSKCDKFIYDGRVNVKMFRFYKTSSGLYDKEKLLLEQRWMFF